MPATPDSNLLFGILALQMDFVSREQLVAATSKWLLDKKRPLDQIMLEQGALDNADREMLVPLVARHIKNHEDDPEKSLAALGGVSSIVNELSQLGDRQLDQTLSIIGARNVGEHVDDAPDTRFGESSIGSATVGVSTSVSERFRILRSHAKGGLGEVSVAHDQELNREVALKQIQGKFAEDQESRSRFLLEAEITGRLEHPGIVPVYGLGQYPDGRPFYAMRFIRGDSLQEAVDRFHGGTELGKLTRGIDDHPESPNRTNRNRSFESVEFRKLLGRFIDVCNAIGYAHSRGVLHRDLKPGNIMLGKYGETMVVDWGLAKPAGRSEAYKESGEEHTLSPSSGSGSAPTQMGSAIGTPAYMPPEQAAGRVDELSTTSDVYSLGASLYYLLTGEAPIQEKSLEAVLRKAQKGDFPAPREVDPQVPKALEAICLRAMELKPGDRYESPQLLAEDVERYLADEPVSAFVEPLVVRIRRWVRKHSATAAALAATLFIGLISTVLIATVVSGKNRALSTANGELDIRNSELAATNEALAAAETKAQQEAEIARAINRFLNDDLLAKASPDEQPDRDVKLRAILDRAAQDIDGRFEGQPLIEAALRQTIGEAYKSLGEYHTAEPHLERARWLREQQLGEEHADTLHSVQTVADLYDKLGFKKKARELHERTLEKCLRVLGDQHPRTLAGHQSVGNMLYVYSRYPEAEEHIRRAIEGRKKVLGENHPDTFDSWRMLADVQRAQGDYDDARSTLENVLGHQQSVLGDEHPSTLSTMQSLASIDSRLGFESKAEDALREILATKERTLGSEHSSTLSTRARIADLLRRRGRYPDAEAIHKEILEVRRKTLGDDHLEVAWSLDDLASVYVEQEQFDQAIPIIEEVIRRYIEVWGDESVNTQHAIDQLAWAYFHQGRYAEAIPIYEKSLAIRRRELGEEHPSTLISMVNLASNYSSAGRTEEALELERATLTIARKTLGDKHPTTFMLLHNLAGTMRRLDRNEEAVALRQEAVKNGAATLGNDHPDVLRSQHNLANALDIVGDDDEALQLMDDVVVKRRRVLGDENEETLHSIACLGVMMMKLNRDREAETLLDEAVDTSVRVLGEKHPTSIYAIAQRARLARKRHAWSKANELSERAWVGYTALEGPRGDSTAYELKQLKRVRKNLGQVRVDAELYEKAFRHCEQSLGENHRNTMLSLVDWGKQLREEERDEEAARLLEQASAGLKKELGDFHPETRACILELCGAYSQLGKDSENVPWRKVLVNGQRKKAPGSVSLAADLAQLALSQLRAELYSDAEPVAAECLEIRAREMPEHPYYFGAKSLLGWSLLGQGRHQEAESLLLEAYDGLEARVSPRDEGLQRTVARLLELYDQDNAEEYEKWKGRKAGLDSSNQDAKDLRKEISQLVEAGEFAEAIELYHQIDKLPAQRLNVVAIASLYARMMDWEKSSEMWRSLGRDTKVDRWNLFRAMCAAHEAGDDEEFQAVKAMALSNAEQVDDPDWPWIVLIGVLLRPLLEQEHAAVEKLVDLFASKYAGGYYAQRTIALAQYRLGKSKPSWEPQPEADEKRHPQQRLIESIVKVKQQNDGASALKLVEHLHAVKRNAEKQVTDGRINSYWWDYVERMAIIDEGKRALAQSDHQEAALAHLAVLAESDAQAATLRQEANKLLEEDKIAQSLALHQQISELPGQELDLEAVRDHYARLLQWEKAHHAYQNSVGLNDYRAIFLLYECDRHEDYLAARRKRLADYKSFNNDWRVYAYLQMALLLPLEKEIHDAIRHMADANVDAKEAWRKVLVGRAMYWLGEFDPWYDSLPKDSPLRSGHDFILAITSFQRERSDETQQSLEEAIRKEEASLERMPKNGELDKNWHAHMRRIAMIREAKRVLNATAEGESTTSP